MIIKNDSPHFSQLISWLKREDLQKLRKFFPLQNMDTWLKRKYRSKYYSFVDIDKIRNEIHSELIDPLFVKSGINVGALYCLFEAFIKDLRGAKYELDENKFKGIIQRFFFDFKEIVPSLAFPFSWMLEPKKINSLKTPMSKLIEKWEDLEEEKSGITDNLISLIIKRENLEQKTGYMQDRTIENIVAMGLTKKDREQKKLEEKYIQAKRERAFLDQKIDIAIKTSWQILERLQLAKGKPGRHPKPYNVFVYHLINKCSLWKFNENRKYVYHKDGQHKLERNWKLVLFLILETHLRVIKLPRIEQFISEYKSESANDALRSLKQKLWDSYKNFSPKQGWPMLRKPNETGFRKLIINEDQELDIVML